MKCEVFFKAGRCSTDDPQDAVCKVKMDGQILNCCTDHNEFIHRRNAALGPGDKPWEIFLFEEFETDLSRYKGARRHVEKVLDIISPKIEDVKLEPEKTSEIASLQSLVVSQGKIISSRDEQIRRQAETIQALNELVTTYRSCMRKAAELLLTNNG